MDRNISKFSEIGLKYAKNREEYRDFRPLKYAIFAQT